MKIKAITSALGVFLACVALAFAVASTVSHSFADPASAAPASAAPASAPSPAVLDASALGTPPAVIAAVPLSSPVAAGDLLSTLGAPSWVVTVLSVFATVSIAYQSLIAFAHKRAAETADLKDDQWIASLEAKTWFKILDKVFYWGGYLGAKIGNRKL